MSKGNQELPEPFNLSLTEFLTGPDGDEDKLDIDPIFGKDLDTVLRDMREFDPSSIAFDDETPRSRSAVVEGYIFVRVADGVLLLDPDGNIAGAYVSCDIVVDDPHQFQGLGAELIIERALRDAALPTWWLDKAAYTPAGLAAHQSAWRMARSKPEILREKINRIEVEAEPMVTPRP
jgi:GNAT superfamily N-acetyltransferase